MADVGRSSRGWGALLAVAGLALFAFVVASQAASIEIGPPVPEPPATGGHLAVVGTAAATEALRPLPPNATSSATAIATASTVAPVLAATSLPTDAAVAPAHLVVRVLDDRRQPIPAATVTVIEGERDLHPSRSDSNGEAAVPEWAQRVRGTAPGHWPAELALGNGGERCVLLPRARLLHGRVFLADGRPAVQATLALLASVPHRCAFPASLPPAATRTQSDAKGAFSLPWPDPGVHDLVVRAAGTGGAVLAGLSATECGTAPLLVHLQHGASLVGTVLDAAALPIRARLEVWSRSAVPGTPRLGPADVAGDEQLLQTTQANADGTFAVDDLPAGPAWLVCPDLGARVAVTLAAGTTASAQLAVPAAAQVRGRVDTAQPTTVFLFGGARHTHRTRSAADGAFEFPPVPPGRYLLGAVADDAAPGMHAAVQQFLLLGHCDHAHEYVLAAGEQRHVLVPAPTPPSGAVAGQAFVEGQPAVAFAVVLDPIPYVGARARTLAIAVDGSFHGSDLVPGDYEARLVTAGKTSASATCRVLAGSTSTLLLTAP